MSNRDPFDLLTETWEPTIRKAFLDAIRDIAGRVNVSLIATMLEKGDVDGALRAIGLDPVAFRGLDKAIVDTFNAGGIGFESKIPAVRSPDGALLQFRFDVRDPQAEQWARQASSTLVTGIIDDQRTAIRQNLEAGLVEGANPRTTALSLVGKINPATRQREGGIIGLTAQQERWQRNFASEIAGTDPAALQNALTRALRDKRFDGAIRKAIATGEPIPAATQAKMRLAYRNRMLKYRADVIARNETLRALSASQTDAFRQAINKGQVQVETITRNWVTAGDERVRHTHRLIPAMNKDGVGWDEPFQTPSGPSMHAPHDHDIMCRCRETIDIDFAKAYLLRRVG